MNLSAMLAGEGNSGDGREKSNMCYGSDGMVGAIVRPGGGGRAVTNDRYMDGSSRSTLDDVPSELYFDTIHESFEQIEFEDKLTGGLE